jgi:low affinity Fe/Cu permease
MAMPVWLFHHGVASQKIGARFTDIADKISEAAGTWQTTAVCLLLVLIWISLGPRSGFSDSWQLWVNTPTTVIELFLGLFMLAAANRLEKRNYDLHQTMLRALTRLEKLVEREESEIEEMLRRGGDAAR